MSALTRRLLGRTGIEISSLGFGTAPLGDVFGALDEREAIATVHAAIAAGIDYFDTAPLYGFGLAEERLGKALRGRRDRVVVATKCCRDGFEQFDFSAARVAASVEASLQRLQTDHIDVFQIHDVEFGTSEQVLNEALPAAFRLREQGKVRAVGITGLPVRYLAALARRCEVDTILSWGHYNLVEDELDDELVPLARERGFGLMSASPLLQGLLTERAPPRWHRSPQSVKTIAPRIATLCREAGFDVAQVAVNFAARHLDVATTIVGIGTRSELDANLRALTLRIPPGLFAAIDRIVRPIKNMMWFEGRPENNLPPHDPDGHVPELPGTDG